MVRAVRSEVLRPKETFSQTNCCWALPVIGMKSKPSRISDVEVDLLI